MDPEFFHVNDVVNLSHLAEEIGVLRDTNVNNRQNKFGLVRKLVYPMMTKFLIEIMYYISARN